MDWKKTKKGMIGLLAGTMLMTAALSGCSGASAKEKKAMEEYDEFLSQDTITWDGTDGIASSSVQFMTEDLNGDGIPELLVKRPVYDDALFGTVAVYTCIGMGEDSAYDFAYVTQVDASDEVSGYYPDTGVFVMKDVYNNDDGSALLTYELYDYLADMYDYFSIYGISSWTLSIGASCIYEDGTVKYSWYGIYDEENPDEWYDNAANDSITEEEFEAQLADLTSDTEKVQLEENWLDNTAENRKKALK